MGIFLDENALVPALQKMPRSVMPFIECLGVYAVELPHAQSKVSLRRLKKQVIVIVHEAIGVTEPVVAFIDTGQNGKKGCPIVIVFKDRFLFVTTRGHVVYRAGVLNA